MNKAFILNLLFLIFVNLLIKPFFIFGIDRSIQNAVGPENYGVYFTLLNFTFLFQIINDFGIQQFNNRNIAQHNQLVEKYLPHSIVLKLGLGVIYTLFICLAAWIWGYLPEYQHILGFFVLNQILVSMILFLRSNISALGFYWLDSLISVLDRLLLIILCGILLWFNPWQQSFQIEWFIYAQSFTLSITAVVVFFLVYSKIRYFRFRFNWAFIVLIIKESWTYALMVFLATVYTRIDAVMVERLLDDGKYEAGVYAAAYRLLDALNMIAFLFATLLLPMFSKLLKESKKEVLSLLRLSFELLMAGAIPLAVGIFFFQVEISQLLYDNANIYWAQVLGLLILTFIAICTIYIYGTLLTANNSTYYLNILASICFLLNITLNYFLILEYKALGATIATLITQFGMAITQVFLVQHILKRTTNWGMIFRITTYILLVILLNYYLYPMNIQWQFSFIGIILVNIVIAFALKLIDIRYLLKIISSNA